MKKNVFYLLTVFFVLNSCNREEFKNEGPAVEMAKKEPLATQQINAQINQSIQNTGSFNWSESSDHFLWSAIYQGNAIASIGFGTSEKDFDRSLSSSSKEIENEILTVIQKYEGGEQPRFLITSDKFLNQMDVVIKKKETIVALRHMKTIRYLEPGDYRYFDYENKINGAAKSDDSSSGSGCGFNSVTLDNEDYTSVTTNTKVPWAFSQHHIPDAWEYSTGSGVTIGLIDTGVSPEQTLLGNNFNTGGSSSERTITKNGVFVDSAWPWSTDTDGVADKCGHGTKMASVIASPRNNSGLPVGVAYNANLVTYRAASDVFLDSFHEQNGVKTAFTELGNNTSVKIISMSMGHIFSVGKIKDGVKYAYSKGKLIFSAGGTSSSVTNFVGVIFPADMPEIQAVTGVKEGTSNQRCKVCHSGKEIAFTFEMERASGKTVPVLSYYNGKADYVGGSSVATAATAGIAALVWSKNPSWTRDQVIDKMRKAATYYPTVNKDYGYGNIDVLKAVQ